MAAENLIPSNLPAYANNRSFLRLGKQFVDASKAIGGLSAASRVLDVGCGVGRFAVGLTDLLDEGTYDGTDVAESSVEACREAITPLFPNFRFHLIEASNAHYAPEHENPASDVPFTFHADTFDLVFANSLFTHLLEADTIHYFNEMARVLRPDGAILVTIFLLNDRSLAAVRAGKSVNQWTLDHRLGQAFVEKADNPEAVVAYEERFIESVLGRAGLAYEIHHGRWSGGYGGHPYFGNKDIIVARKL